MGNCGGRSSYENIIDDFFVELNLTHFNNKEVQIILSNNINNNTFCDNKIECFKSNLIEYLQSFSENPEYRAKTLTFWQKSFLSFTDRKDQFYFLCCICFLCKYEKSTLHLTISNIANLMKFDLDQTRFSLNKVQLKEMLSFYFYFITVFVIEIFNQTEKEKEVFFPTMFIVYKEKNRMILLEEILKNYNETINLEKFFTAEMDTLHHINVRKILNEIHLKSE